MDNLQDINIINKDFFLQEFNTSVSTCFEDMSYEINTLVTVLDVKCINLAKIKHVPSNITIMKKLAQEINIALLKSKNLIENSIHESFLNFITNIDKF